MSRIISKPRAVSSAVLAVLPALLLAACGGASDSTAPSQSLPESQAGVADSAQVDAAIEDTPCALVTPEMVATVFDVPAVDLEQSHSRAMSSCTYTREGDGGGLEATVSVERVYEDAESAASGFRSITAGMSGAKLDHSMAGIQKSAREEGDLDATGKRGAADTIIDNSGNSGGIQFEDVEEVGDEARLALTVGAGKLYVRAGNLNFTVAAYSGPDMRMPAKLTPDAIMDADEQWRRETMPQRKQAAVKLARAVIASL